MIKTSLKSECILQLIHLCHLRFDKILFSSQVLDIGHLCLRKNNFSFCCADSFIASKSCSNISHCLGIPVLLYLFLFRSICKAQLKGHLLNECLVHYLSWKKILPFETSQFFLRKTSNSYQIVPFSLNTCIHFWSVHRSPRVLKMAWEGSENCDILWKSVGLFHECTPGHLNSFFKICGAVIPELS